MSAILAAIQAVLHAIPALAKILQFFKKAPQEKIDDTLDELRKEVDKFKETGRPGQ